MEEDLCCRICLESDERINLIAPCSCSGTQKWVHRECLNKWRAMREDRAFSRCTECLTSYILISPKDEKKAKYWGNIRFYCFCFRDIFLALFCILLLTVFFGFLTYEIDRTKYLVSLFSCQKRILLFYYGCGVFIFLSLIGILSSLAACFNIGNLGSVNCPCDSSCCRSNDIYLPLYFNNDPACCCCCNHHECSSCATCCNSCESCALCEGCTAASCEQEALVFVLIGLVIFAIIGIFVSVIVGILFVQKVANSHVHYLHKRVLAHDYIVKDLESNNSGDIELGETKGKHIQEEYQRIRNEENIENSGYLSATQQQELDRLGLL